MPDFASVPEACLKVEAKGLDEVEVMHIHIYTRKRHTTQQIKLENRGNLGLLRSHWIKLVS